MSNIHQINVQDEGAYLELYQYDNGQILEFVTTSVADGTNVLFGGPKTRKAFRRIVENSQVAIPNKLLRETGKIQVTVETLTEDAETTIYDIAGYVKRRQEGGFDVEPEDEPTIIEVIFNKLKELTESVADLFRDKADKSSVYTKDETDSKDSATLDSAKSYTNTIALGLGNDLVVDLNTSTYVLTLTLKHGNQTLATRSVDLPLESTVVSGRYDKTSKKLILTLVSGEVIEIPLGDLIDGLVSIGDLESALANYYLASEIDNLLLSKVDKIETSEEINLPRTTASQSINVSNYGTIDINCESIPSLGSIFYIYNDGEDHYVNVTDKVNVESIDISMYSSIKLFYSGDSSDVDVEYTLKNEVVRERTFLKALEKVEEELDEKQDELSTTNSAVRIDGTNNIDVAIASDGGSGKQLLKHTPSHELFVNRDDINEVPNSSSSDSGKLLTVDSNGNPVWTNISQAENESF